MVLLQKCVLNLFLTILLCRREEGIIISIRRLTVSSTEQLHHSGNWMGLQGVNGNRITLALTESNGKDIYPVSYCGSQKITCMGRPTDKETGLQGG